MFAISLCNYVVLYIFCLSEKYSTVYPWVNVLGHDIHACTRWIEPAHQNQPTSFKGQRRNVLALTGHKHTGGRPGLLRVGTDSRQTDRGSTTTHCIYTWLVVFIWKFGGGTLIGLCTFQVLFILAVVCTRARLVDLSPG